MFKFSSKSVKMMDTLYEDVISCVRLECHLSITITQSVLKQVHSFSKESSPQSAR
jgi:hypothetical protein